MARENFVDNRGRNEIIKIFGFVVLVGFLILGMSEEVSAVSCEDTITSNTVLTSDLYCDGDGIIIGTDSPDSGITLECGGHTISHTGGRSGTGISAEGTVYAIKNCKITNFKIGIDISGYAAGYGGGEGDANRGIHGNKIYNNNYGIFLTECGHYIHHNEIYNNDNTGFYSYGIKCAAWVKSNTICNNGLDANLWYKSYNVITDKNTCDKVYGWKDRSSQYRCDYCCSGHDGDSDGWCSVSSDDSVLDCNDNDANVSPGKAEVCDGKDNNCNDQTDENVKNTYYGDADNDGYGNPSQSTQACSQPSGYVSNNNDCNDNDNKIYPNAPELCDGIDNDCSNGVPANESDSDNDGWRICAGDCNDNNKSICPNCTDIPGNGIDEDCSGGDLQPSCWDNDSDGYYASECGGNDCDDNDSAIHVDGVEIAYNGKNDDCSNFTRDDDLDGDGYGRANDCNDLIYFIHPTANEIECNGRDEDCDGVDYCICGVDNDSDGYYPYSVDCPNGLDCDDNNKSINPLGIEIPDNNIDENCDGIDIKSPPPSPYTNPDLTIKSITTTPRIPNVGETITIKVLVENEGTTTQSNLSDVKISLYINGALYQSKTENLQNIRSKNVDFTFTPTNSGIIKLKAIMDPDNSVTESNEHNNVLFKDIGTTKESSNDAGCDDSDPETIDLSINGHCIYAKLLDGGLIDKYSTNKVTLDTTVYFYWNIYGDEIWCDNLDGVNQYAFLDERVKQNLNLMCAECSSPKISMKIIDPNSQTSYVSRYILSNGIINIPINFSKKGNYTVSLNKICIEKDSGNEDCISYGYDYSFDVVEEDINLKSGLVTKDYIKGTLGPEAGVTVPILEVKAEMGGVYGGLKRETPRSYTVHYRGDKTFPDSDIKNSDVDLSIGKEVNINGGAESHLAKVNALGGLVDIDLGANIEFFYTNYESDIFEFGTLSSNTDAFYNGAYLMTCPDIINILLSLFIIPSLLGYGNDVLAPMYYSPFVDIEGTGLNNYKTKKIDGWNSGLKPKIGVDINVANSNFGLGGGDWVPLSYKMGTEDILSNSNQSLGFCSYNSKKSSAELSFAPSYSYKSNYSKFGIHSTLLNYKIIESNEGVKVCYYGDKNEINLKFEDVNEKTEFEFDSDDVDSVNSFRVNQLKNTYSSDSLYERVNIALNAGDVSRNILNNINDAQPVYKLTTSDDFVHDIMLKAGAQVGAGFEVGFGGSLFGDVNEDVEKGVIDSSYGVLPIYKRPLKSLNAGSTSLKFANTIYIEPVKNKILGLKEDIEKILGGPTGTIIACILGGQPVCDISAAWNLITNAGGTIISIAQTLGWNTMHIHIIDEYSREIYYNYTTDEYINEIPGAFILRNITADKIANYTNSTNITYNIHEAIYIPEGIKFKVYVDAHEAHNATEPYKLVVASYDAKTNTTASDVIEDNITKNQLIQYSIDRRIINGNITITVENKTTEICGNGICAGTETVANCHIDCDNESPVIHAAGLIKIGEIVRITANATDNEVIPLVFINIKSSTGEVNLTIPYDNLTKTHYLNAVSFQSDKFNFTFMVYDNIKKPPVTYNLTNVTITKNVSLSYLNDLNITLPYNLTYYQDSVIREEIEAFRPFNIEFNFTNFKIEFKNVTAKRLMQRNLPLIYPISNVTLNETPSRTPIRSGENEFLPVDPLSIEIYMGENATYTTELKIRKTDVPYVVIKCDTVLFGECVNPKIISEDNYSVVGDWILLNISSFFAYGTVDKRPDLNQIAMVYTPKHPKVNQNITVFSMIENQGFGDAAEVNVSLFVDNIYEQSKTISLSSDSQEIINFTTNDYVLNINLKKGWNLISIPAVPGDNGISNILAAIDGKYERVLRFNSTSKQYKNYQPPPFPVPANDFNTIESGRGYWISVTEDCNISVRTRGLHNLTILIDSDNEINELDEGNNNLTIVLIKPQTTSIDLVTGWNLIGPMFLGSRNISDALSSIGGKYERVLRFNSTSKQYENYQPPPFPVNANDFNTIESRLGYWISATDNTTLIL